MSVVLAAAGLLVIWAALMSSRADPTPMHRADRKQHTRWLTEWDGDTE